MSVAIGTRLSGFNCVAKTAAEKSEMLIIEQVKAQAQALEWHNSEEAEAME